MRRLALRALVCVYEALFSGTAPWCDASGVEVRVLRTINGGWRADVPVGLLGRNERAIDYHVQSMLASRRSKWALLYSEVAVGGRFD